MVDKIKEIIDKNKENKDNFIGYIESFTENDKANELYNTNDEFK